MNKHNRRVNFLLKFSSIKRKKDDAVRHQHTQAYKSRLQELVPSGISMQYWAIYQWSSCMCRLAHTWPMQDLLISYLHCRSR